MKEVITQPGIGHGGLRRRGLQGGVSIDGGDRGQPPGIRNPKDADAAIILWNVFD